MHQNERGRTDISAGVVLLKPATLEKSLLELNEVVGADHLVVTRAERGAALVDASGAYCESPGVVVVVDTVGSGDSFTARLV